MQGIQRPFNGIFDEVTGALEGYRNPVTNEDVAGTFAATDVLTSGFSSANFRRWRTALANVRNGASGMKVLCIGDSTTQGQGSDTRLSIPQNASYPIRLASLLNSYYAPAMHGLVTAPQVLNSLADNRWTYTGEWAESTFSLGNSGTLINQNGLTGSAICTPGVDADTYDVYYIAYPGGGTITATATGGTPVVQSTNVAANILKITCVAASSSTANTVTITNAVGNSYISCIEPRNSSVAQIRVGNAGVGSSKASDWVLNPTSFGAPKFINVFAPHLTIIQLGINDAAGTTPSVATFTANLQTLITSAKVSGDVIIATSIASNGLPYLTHQTNYNAAMQTLAETNNCGFVDIYTRLGGVYSASNTLYFDGLHPSSAGYWDIADTLFKILRRL